MKILFLNPHLQDAPLVKQLQGLGVAVLVCNTLKEGELVLKLHASSLSLFVGHDEDGVALNETIKANPRYSRIPVILTTSKWSDQQCNDHQASPQGANAYLRLPVEDKEFIHVVDQILGTELSHGKGFNVSDDLSSSVALATASNPEGGIDILPLAPIQEEATALSIVAAPSEAAPLSLEQSDGVTLVSEIGDPTRVAISSSGVQIEDAAAVYGQPTPSSGEIDPSLVFTLEAPNLDGQERDGGLPTTKEFKIEAENLTSSIASEILATPIEATSIDAISPEGPTQVALESPTRVHSPADPEPYFQKKTEPETGSSELDSEALSVMPYLGKSPSVSNPLSYREPMDDAVVPGGAAQAPDTETLKKYLYLREQDVSALSAQLRQAREQIGLLENQLRHEKSISSEFAHLVQEQDRRIGAFEKEKAVALESAEKEIEELKFEMKRRSEKIRVMELQVREATEATERLKERVRQDIRKIRTREKELENRLEIMKKDSEALLGSREQKIIDLKRKLDLMEFNMDLQQELLEKEKAQAAALRDKLMKAAQMMRVAGGILGPEEEALLGGQSSEAGVNPKNTTAA